MHDIDTTDIEVDSYIPRRTVVEQENDEFKYVDIFCNEADGSYYVNTPVTAVAGADG